jgi:2',3'-cyclic-nucleotide 2'-phosphodiesterase (5'-nucleotidase family)
MRAVSRTKRVAFAWAALGLWVASPLCAQDALAITLSIVTTNDVHGRITQLPLFGGYVHNLRASRARDHGAVILLDAGDIFQGTLESNSSEGASMVRAYNALGYKAAAIGNHEFDFGPAGPHATPIAPGDDPLGALRARANEAKFPFLCSNMCTHAGAAFPIAKVRPSMITEVAGVRVGIIGGVTRDALRSTHPGNTHALEVMPLAAAVGAQAQALRKQGARVVIAVVHAGGECRDLQHPDDLSSCDPQAEVFELARALPQGAVDLIVAGHTHAGIAQRVAGVPIIEAFSNGRAFGRADLMVPHAPKAALSVKLYPPESLCTDVLDKPVCTQASYEGAPVARDAAVLSAIAKDLQQAQAARDQPLGVVVTTAVARAGTTESPLNNLVADLMLRASPGADAAFNNAGGVRIPLPAGPLSYGTVFEMFPFDNTLAILHLQAKQLAHILITNLAADGGILALAGLRASAACEQGELKVKLLDSNGQVIDPERSLSVVTSDFLASQTEGAMAGLSLPPGAIQIERDRSMRDALVAGLRAYPEGRIDGADPRLFDPKHPRIQFAGVKPLICKP